MCKDRDEAAFQIFLTRLPAHVNRGDACAAHCAKEAYAFADAFAAEAKAQCEAAEKAEEASDE